MRIDHRKAQSLIEARHPQIDITVTITRETYPTLSVGEATVRFAEGLSAEQWRVYVSPILGDDDEVLNLARVALFAVVSQRFGRDVRLLGGVLELWDSERNAPLITVPAPGGGTREL